MNSIKPFIFLSYTCIYESIHFSNDVITFVFLYLPKHLSFFQSSYKKYFVSHLSYYFSLILRLFKDRAY